MGGTIEGGLQTAKTVKQVYGSDYYQRVGRLGGRAFHKVRGFQGMSMDKVRAAGRKGGALSRKNQTHCHNGHPLSGDNLYSYTYHGSTSRQCKTCSSVRQKAARLRKQESLG